VGARGRRPLWSFISFIFSYLLLFIWPLPCPARQTDGPCPAHPALPYPVPRFFFLSCQCRRQTDGGDKHRGRNPHALLLFALRIPSVRPNDLSVSSPWEFRLPGRTICPSLRLENSVCQAEWSVRLFALRISSARPNDLYGPVPPVH
jgi:hypothetical protein